MAKRRYLNQLPAILQTQTLQQFFSATVDQLFQPGVTESMNALIGRKPSYFNELRDFYKAESTAERQFYQLEAAMTAKADDSAEYSDLLFYQDLVNSLRFHGANTTDHSRLFESEMYSWCPPIDVNKLVNYKDYYWMPDGPPVLVIEVPSVGGVATYRGDGLTSRYTIPSGVLDQTENLAASVDGVMLTNEQFNQIGSEVVLVSYDDLSGLEVETPLARDSIIKIWRNSDYLGDGVKKTFELPASVPGAVVNITAHIDGVALVNSQFTIQNNRLILNSALANGSTIEIWMNSYFEQNINGKDTFTLSIPAKGYAKQTQQNEFTGLYEVITFAEVVIDTPPALERFFKIEIRDNQGTKSYQVNRTSDDKLQLGGFDDMISRVDPLHTCIERQAQAGSPWSRANHWYHKDVVFYYYDNYKPQKATRPIIEFMGDIKLWNYGLNRIPDVNAIVNTIVENPWNYQGWKSFSPGAKYDTPAVMIDGVEKPLPIGRVMFRNPSTDSGTFDIEDQILFIELFSTVNGISHDVLKYDSTLLAFAIVDSNSPGQYVGVDSKDAKWSNYDNDGWDGEFEVKVSQPGITREWDIFKMVDSFEEHFFNGDIWVAAQMFASTYEPLFDLFDDNSILRNNTATRSWGDYAGSDFAGNKIFAFKRGTGANDAVLGFPLSRNKFSNLDFEDRMNDPISHDGGSVKGFRYFSHINIQYLDIGIDFSQVDIDGTQVNYDGTPVVTNRYANNWNPAGTATQVKGESGFYEIPLGLQANPLNQSIGTISVNDWKQHFKPVIQGNDWKARSESRNLSLGRFILQHRSPLLKTMFLNSNQDVDFMKACVYNEREYTRYFNKFTQTLKREAMNGSVESTNDIVGRLLQLLRVSKTSDFPFTNSSMGLGEWYIPASASAIGVMPTWKPELIIEHSRVKDLQSTFIRGHDGSLISGFTKGDSTNPITTQTIDHRDLVLLGLENRIYTNINPAVRDSRRPAFDITSQIPGKYRTSSYSREEYLNISRPLFERWSAQNQFNYRENKSFRNDNAWTYNYHNVPAFDGTELPGHWRGIYHFYFDTDRPDTHPWEMLGFTSKPAYWDGLYSWTDSAKRAAMVDAMESGLVNPATGGTDPTFARPGIRDILPVDANGQLLDPIQAGLVGAFGIHKFDSPWQYGDRGPVENSWLTSYYHGFTMAQIGYLLKPAKFVESNWLAREELLVHNEQWVNIRTKWRESDPLEVVHNELVNGVLVNKMGIQTWISDYIRSQGKNITTVFGNHIRTLGVNLAHKLGGFIEPQSLKAFTESTGLIPQEDVLPALYRSPSVREEFYGGVITEWTGRGWRLLGYDIVDPVFKIKPVKRTGNRAKISLGDDIDNTVDWKTDTYYTVNLRVHHAGTNYVCHKTHTSSKKFEPDYWTAESVGRLDSSLALAWYFEHEDEVERLPYGTVLTTRQEVADFLSGYQAYLESRGWVFNNFHYDTNENHDFKHSLKEFMYWTQTRWTPGSFIALSPSSENVKFTTTHGSIQNVDQLVNGAYSLVNRAGLAIAPNKISTYRLDDELTVAPLNGDGIFGLRIYISEIENALVFNNSTIFDDVLYDPLFNLRQTRLRVIANISQDWVGRLDAPGFVITDNRLMPSFEQQVEDIRYMYDVEKAINLPLRTNARHQIGYQSRDYLESLMFNDTNQFEFYQGMIQQKGAPGVFNKLLRNDGLTSSKRISFLEEWAFRNGEYGGTEKYESFEFLLNRYQVKAEPQQIEFVSNNSGYDIQTYENTGDPVELLWDDITVEGLRFLDSEEDTVIRIYDFQGKYDPRWIHPKKSHAFDLVDDFTRSRNALPTAGYARVSDTKFQAPTFAKFNEIVTVSSEELGIGDRVWIYGDESKNWDILRTSLPHKSVDFVIHGSDIQSFDRLDSQLNVIEFNQVGDPIYFRINMEGMPGSLAVGSIVSILDDKTPGLGISGIFEVKVLDDDFFLITHQTNEVVIYEPVLSGTLISTDAPMNLSVGDKIYLTREINKTAAIGGIHTVVELGATPYSVIIDASVDSNFTYQLQDEKPRLFKMASVRYHTIDPTKENRVNSLNSQDLVNIDTRIPFEQWIDGELLYVDVCYDFGYQNELPSHKRRWSVYRWSQGGFTQVRRQPAKIRRDMIRDVKLFDTRSNVDNVAKTLNAKPLVNANILILDPSQGLVPGVAQADVWYKLEYDPASYNTGPGMDEGLEWGEKERGRLWWDLSTTYYLINETDEVLAVQDRDYQELEHRQNSWGKIAPGSSIDIYEWTKSYVLPDDWQAQFLALEKDKTFDGATYLSGTTPYVTSTEWNEALSKFVPVYFFWVRNRVYTPQNVDFRKMSANQVSEILSNPLGQNIAWIAPISKNSLITSSLTEYLSPTTSMQLTVARTNGDSIRHVEWKLMRKGDERSLPDADLWTKLTGSLAGRDVWGKQNPDLSRYFTDRIGYDVKRGQNLFRDIKSARRHMTTYLNRIFAQILLVDERRDLSVLLDAEGSRPELVWTQGPDSFYIKPIPHKKLWNGLVDNLTSPEEPRRVIGETDGQFSARLAQWRFLNNRALQDTTPYVFDDGNHYLMRNLRMGEAHWSVTDQERWDNLSGTEPWGSIYDADQTVNELEPLGPTNPWTGPGFEWDMISAAKLYNFEVDTFQERNALLSTGAIVEGERVKIRGNAATGGFWTLWELEGNQWKFVQTQRYDTKDAWELIDWYDEGVSPLNQPISWFQNIVERDQYNSRTNDPVTFARIADDGKGRWMWTQLRDGVWEVVAKQNGTMRFKDSVWENAGNYYTGDDNLPETMAESVANRDLGWELDFVLNKLREEILTDEELNSFFFSMIEHAHAEQDYIDWAFKTSFMNVTGYGDRLIQSPVAYADLTDNLLDYIQEVKPYHVKVRDYINKYRLADETANVHATDYDKPVYVDRVTGFRRTLNPYNLADQQILARGKWVNWYDQWRLFEQGVNDGMPLVRKIKVTAAHEDEVLIKLSGSLRVRVTRRGDVGGSMIEGGTQQGFDDSGLLFDLENPAQNRTSIPLFADGLRVDPDVIQYNAEESSVTIGAEFMDNAIYDYKSFGYGATGQIRDIKYWQKAEGVQTFALDFPLAVPGNLSVNLDGRPLAFPEDFGLLNGVLTVTRNSAGFLAVAMLENSNDAFDSVTARSFKGMDLVDKTFADLHPELANPTRAPISQNFIIEVDGLRKQTEWTHNINVHSMNRQILLERDGPVADLRAWFEGEEQQIADGVWKPYTITNINRKVSLVAYSDLDSMTIIDADTGEEVIIGRKVYPTDGPTTPTSWDEGTVGWETWSEQWEEAGGGTLHEKMWGAFDDFTWANWGGDTWANAGGEYYIVVPSNAQYTLDGNVLESVGPLAADQNLLVNVNNYVPESLTGYQWGDASAENVIKINDVLIWARDSFGRLLATDAVGDFQITDLVLEKFPEAMMVTVTDLVSAKNMGIHTHSWVKGIYDKFPISALAPNKHSYWVNVNGRHLVNGRDYEVIDIPYAYDEFAWDDGGWIPEEYYLQGMVAGQNLAGYDGYRGFAMTKELANTLVPGNRFRPRRYEEFEWDHEVVAIKFTGYTVADGDVIVATVFAEEQATFQSEFELFVRNTETNQPQDQDLMDDLIANIRIEDKFVLTSELTLGIDSFTVTKMASPFYRTSELSGPGRIWVGTELIEYEDAVYDANAKTTTFSGLTRGVDITTRYEHEVGSIALVTSEMHPKYMPL